jgi:hypothetical protein
MPLTAAGPVGPPPGGSKRINAGTHKRFQASCAHPARACLGALGHRWRACFNVARLVPDSNWLASKGSTPPPFGCKVRKEGET